MINILIADDHLLFREGIKQIFARRSIDINVVDEVDNGQELLNKVRKNSYHAVILDISLPGRSGIEILTQLHEENPDLPVLILSMYPESQYAFHAIKAGAYGYLTKDTDPESLIEAVRQVSSGKRYITPKVANELAHRIGDNPKENPHEILSDREYEIMCKLAKGKTVSEIARDAFLSVKTISTYRRRILEKMNLNSNIELTYYAIKKELI